MQVALLVEGHLMRSGNSIFDVHLTNTYEKEASIIKKAGSEERKHRLTIFRY